MDGSGRLFAGSWLRTHVLTGLITFCVLLFHSTPVRAGLYDGNLPLVNLNASNFYDVLLGKENAWIIQFYSSWCGHCIHFAPMFKAFAHDISGWRQVLGLAVMDCTEVTNIKFCRLFEVTSFPTLVFLGTKATRTDRGEVIEAHRSITNLRHQALSLLQGNHSTGPHPKPPSWPSLDPLPDSEVSLAQLWNGVPQQVHTMVIVLESQASLIGQEVTLDLSGNPHCRVWRLVNPSPSSPLLWELSEAGSQPDNSTTQAIIYTVLRDSKAKFLLRVPYSEGSRKLVVDALLPLRTSEDTIELGSKDNASENGSHAGSSRVYRADLNNAMVYSLSQEVALWETFNRSQLEVLENFVDVLRQFFPGDPSTMHFLGRLQKYVASFRERGHVLRGEALSTFLHAAGSPDSRLPKMGPYVGCLGSRPGLRGYPCSLWMLFHSLTVNAYRASAEHELASGDHPTSARTTLLTIRDYVSHFFTCSDCAAHFASQAVGLESKLREPRDAVLWLWRTHNAVNRRLSGDQTEDPAAPKVPFPPESLCSECRTSRGRQDTVDWNVRWNVDRTLHFLLRYYSGDSVVTIVALPNEPAGTWRGPSIMLPLALTAVLLVLLLVALLGPFGCGRRKLRPCRKLCTRRGFALPP